MAKFQWFFLTLLLTAFCVSCLKGKSKKSSSIKQQDEIVYGDQGLYRTLLMPVNSQFGDIVSGTMDVSILGDFFEVQGTVLGAPANSKHLQFISEGTRCPESKDDINKDGIIDLEELIKVSGKILIPLDSDLSEQLSGSDFGPIANNLGKYVYKESTSFSVLLSDLLSDDPDRTDIFQKLSTGEKLKLEKKVMVVLGLRDGTIIPLTVKNPSTHSSEESVPIACGEFSRVSDENRL